LPFSNSTTNFDDYFDLIHVDIWGTPQQNSVIERKHQHVLNVTRSLLFQSSLPKCYWSYVVNHVVHLINKMPSAILKNKSPYEMLY